jgi:hypothetical protein
MVSGHSRHVSLAHRSALLALTVTVAITLMQGCGSDSERVAAFNEQYAATVELLERTVAASYPYQLAEAPETEIVNRVFARIRTRSASRADFEEALAAERERGWYLDHFASEIEALRAAIAELSRRAGAIGQTEVREAAVEVYRQFAAALESAAGLLAAQRARSQQIVVFFTEIISRERRFPALSEMAATGEQMQRLRESMLQTMHEHRAAFGKFQNLAAAR